MGAGSTDEVTTTLAPVDSDPRFDALEAQLGELRRSLGIVGGSGDSTAATASSTSAPAFDHGPDPVGVAEAPVSGRGARSVRVDRAEPAHAAADRPVRGGLGLDLVLLAFGWSALIVLTVRLLLQA